VLLDGSLDARRVYTLGSPLCVSLSFSLSLSSISHRTTD
jgi:hypothetical protein